MAFKDKLPVSYLLFTFKGRINRSTYWVASVFIWSAFYVLIYLLNLISYEATIAVYPLLFWALTATATKRLHDTNKTGYWIFLLLLPVLGPLFLIYLLGFRKGSRLANRFGVVPGSAPDYFKNPDAISIPHLASGEKIVNDITQLNPVLVNRVEAPETVEELQSIISTTDNPVSIAGGRFSMGGQTASHGSIHIDMRRLNKILEFSPENKIIKVQSGTRWCDIQSYIDKHNLSVKTMQTYANFTVGGSLSVNCHGRYMGLGPVILSVLSLDVMLANGDILHTSPQDNPELFFACVGCYNAVAIIVNAELQLVDNVAVKRHQQKMKRSAYKDHFLSINTNENIVFHNADIYPPSYKNVRVVSWKKADKKPTHPTRLMPLAAAYPAERYFIGAFAKSKFGKWRREYLIDPILYSFRKVHLRNYEAGYDVLELEPGSRKESTYVLQEYFVGIDKFNEFSSAMSEIFRRYDVNVINVSIRHAMPDCGSLLAWAKEEVFAFVVWYKQGVTDADKNKVGIWTRELIEAALKLNGSYYLPYQPHATAEQFHRAYPNAKRLFELKEKLDPQFRFRNIIWNTYYKRDQR